MKSIQL